jgi:hypothetical protein
MILGLSKLVDSIESYSIKKFIALTCGMIYIITFFGNSVVAEKSQPDIWVAPSELNYILKEGITAFNTLTIGNNASASGNLTFNISFAGEWGGGWIEQWNHTYGGLGHSQLAQPVGDIDEDGINEIILGGYASGGAWILSYNDSSGNYEEEYFWTHSGGYYNAISGACVVDLDGNGELELVASWEYSGEDGIHAYDWDGNTLTELDYYNDIGYNFAFDVYACDYDEDDDVEVLIANDNRNGGNAHVTALGWNSGSFVYETSWGSGESSETPMVWSGDTDNDGHIEVIASGSSNKVYALNWNGSQWNADVVASGLPAHTYAIVAGDIDADGVDEIGFGLYATDAYIYDWDGSNYSQVWHENYIGEEDIIEAMYFGDADNDAEIELLVGTDDVHVISYNAGTYQEESVITQTDGQLAGAIIADMDNDGENEVKACDILSGPGKEWIVEYKEEWLSVDQMSGIVGIGETINLNLTINATDLNVGSYNAFVVISSNDPDESIISIPVNLTVVFGITSLLENWNFISSPYNQSIMKKSFLVYHWGDSYNWSESVNLGYISEYIFGWNRSSQSYIFANNLEPGFGYWLYAYGSSELWIENMTITSNEYITGIEPGWNIIGVPFEQPVNKTNILVDDVPWDTAVLNGKISDFVFGWNRDGQSYIFADTLFPGYAYWMYAYQPCTLKRDI